MGGFYTVLKTIAIGAFLAFSILALVSPAHAETHVSIGIGLPGFFEPPPVVVAPPIVAPGYYGYYRYPGYYYRPWRHDYNRGHDRRYYRR
jgi:hypothetical protein